MHAALIVLLISLRIFAEPPYDCGHTEKRKRPYGSVEVRVECDLKEDDILSVIEYKGNIQHGFQLDYDSLWRKRDSLFFVNGIKEGLALFWDTLGNVRGRENYRQGKHVGVMEWYWEPGRPSLLKHYNAQGKEDGPWKEWWRNGNPKLDVHAKNGSIASGTEYYPDGKPRLRFNSKPLAPSESLFKRKTINGEAWTPNGKSTGRIVGGNGEWTVFSAEPDSVRSRYDVYREVFKDSLMIHVHKLDSSEIARWLE